MINGHISMYKKISIFVPFYRTGQKSVVVCLLSKNIYQRIKKVVSVFTFMQETFDILSY